MKYLHFTEQDYRYARAFPFFDIRAKGSEQHFDIAPLNIGGCWMRENGDKRFGVLTFHFRIVSLCDTVGKRKRSGICVCVGKDEE